MATIIDKLQDPNFTKLVLSRLKEVADKDLNSKGVVAGQAVSSAITELLNIDISPVYNDVDIFIPMIHSTFSLEMKKKKTLQDNEMIEAFSASSFISNYGGMGINASKKYSIIAHGRYGMLNKIWVEIPTNVSMQKNYKRTMARYIVSDFDINSTQVGIWLDKDEPIMIFTEAFLKYLETRQLEVTKWNTPAHSLIRLIKKRDELNGVYVDIEENAMLASTLLDAMNVNDEYNDRFMDIAGEKGLLPTDRSKLKRGLKFSIFQSKRPLFFGDKMLKTYYKYEAELSKYVTLKNKIVISMPKKGIITEPVELHTLIGKGDSREKYLEELQRIPSFNSSLKLSSSLKDFYLNLESSLSIEPNFMDKALENISSNSAGDLDAMSFRQVDNVMETLFYNVSTIIEEENLKFNTILRDKTPGIEVGGALERLLFSSPDTYRGFKKTKKSGTNYFFKKAEDLNKKREDIPMSLTSKDFIENVVFNSISYRAPYIVFGKDQSDIDKLTKFISKYRTHSDLVYNFVSYVEDDKVWEMLDNVEFWVNDYGIDIFGLLENRTLKVEKLGDHNEVRSILKREQDKLNKLLKNKIETVNREDLYIEELVTRKGLKEEGEELRHCVGGYGEAVENGRSIILKVNTKSSRVTIELTVNKESGRNKLIQCKAKSNKLVPLSTIHEALKEIDSLFNIFPLDKAIVKRNFANEEHMSSVNFGRREGLIISDIEEKMLFEYEKDEMTEEEFVNSYLLEASLEEKEEEFLDMYQEHTSERDDEIADGYEMPF